MKKFISCALLVAGAASSLWAESVSLPYFSDMFVTYGTLDRGWSNVNNGRRSALGFSYDSDNTGAALATPGTTSAAMHGYDSEYNADCWLISPAVSLKAGGNYEVSIWAKTKGSDSENFRIYYGSAPDTDALSNLLLDKKDFVSADDYSRVSATLVPEQDITVYFGVNCYSEADSYVLSLTGFCISDENGSTAKPDIPDDPGQIFDIPFVYEFNSSADFFDNWALGYGDNAGVKDYWKVNEYSGWLVFDVAQYEQEDNWVTSPRLNFSEAGEYALTYTGMVNGKLEFLIGSERRDISDYKHIDFLEVEASYDNDVEYVFPFVVDTPGEYRIAVRACADEGTYMGYRMKSLKVRSNLPVPSPVADIKAVADPDDKVQVNVSWTNPALDHNGAPLSSISQLQLFRNGVLIKDDFDNLAVGAPCSWTDSPESAGVYSYSVVAANENGVADAVPLAASAGFVGRPVADMPYEASNERADDMYLMTSVDANNDGIAWSFSEGSYAWYNSMAVKMTEDGSEFDDYLVSPYLSLNAGYYAVSYALSCRYNSVEVGYVRNRHNPAESFVKVGEILNWQDWSTARGRNVFVIDETGDYALCIHAVGAPSVAAYPEISFGSLSLVETKPLPGAAYFLHVSDLTESKTNDVLLSWCNPLFDNAGRDLPYTEPLSIKVLRNDEVIANLSGESYTPGEYCQYVDINPPVGDYTYSIIPANANGDSEDEPASVLFHVGPAVEPPYETSNFSDWQFDPESMYPWVVDPFSGIASWESEYTYNPVYTIFTPYLHLYEGAIYDVEAVFDGRDFFTQNMAFVSNYVVDDYTAVSHFEFTLPEDAFNFPVKFTLKAGESWMETTADNDNEDNKEDIPYVFGRGGKVVLGFRATEAGNVTLKSFSIKRHNSGGSSVDSIAEEIPVLSGNQILFHQPVLVTVADLTGRVIFNSVTDNLNLAPLRGAGLVIVKARGFETLKLSL